LLTTGDAVLVVKVTMRRLDDAMELGSPPHIQSIKMDDVAVFHLEQRTKRT
jgi:hypothetical protein